MKILLVSEFFPTSLKKDFTGGVEARTYFVAQKLAKRHEVTILTSYIEGSKRDSEMNGVRVLRVGPQRKYSSAGFDVARFFFMLFAIKVGLQVKTDIVEGTNFVNQISSYWIGKLKKVPVVAWTPDVWQGQWFKNMGFSGIFGSLVERYNLSHTDVHFVAISQTVAKKMIAYGVSKSLVSVIPCGIDYSLISKIKKIKRRTKTICLVSRLVNYKNIDLLLKSFAEVKKNFDIKLRIVGQGPQLNKLKKLTSDLHISTDVLFLGFKPKYEEVLREIKSSDIFCFPSTTEGFGIVLIEALGAGVPVIAADLPLNHEITKNKGVLFFEPNNVEDLSNQLISLLDNQKLYTKLQKEIKKVAKQYDWKPICIKTERLYANLLNY